MKYHLSIRSGSLTRHLPKHCFVYICSTIFLLCYGITQPSHAMTVEEELAIDQRLGVLDLPWKINLIRVANRDYLRKKAQVTTGLPPYNQQVRYTSQLPPPGGGSSTVITPVGDPGKPPVSVPSPSAPIIAIPDDTPDDGSPPSTNQPEPIFWPPSFPESSNDPEDNDSPPSAPVISIPDDTPSEDSPPATDEPVKIFWAPNFTGNSNDPVDNDSPPSAPVLTDPDDTSGDDGPPSNDKPVQIFWSPNLPGNSVFPVNPGNPVNPVIPGNTGKHRSQKYKGPGKEMRVKKMPP